MTSLSDMGKKMQILLKKHKTDPDMVEVYTKIKLGGREKMSLMCVIHSDLLMLSEAGDIENPLDENGECLCALISLEGKDSWE